MAEAYHDDLPMTSERNPTEKTAWNRQAEYLFSELPLVEQL
jgi:hypothetical protein